MLDAIAERIGAALGIGIVLAVATRADSRCAVLLVRFVKLGRTSGLYELVQYWYAAPHGADADE